MIDNTLENHLPPSTSLLEHWWVIQKHRWRLWFFTRSELLAEGRQRARVRTSKFSDWSQFIDSSVFKGRVKKNVVFPLYAYQNGQNTYFSRRDDRNMRLAGKLRFFFYPSLDYSVSTDSIKFILLSSHSVYWLVISFIESSPFVYLDKRRRFSKVLSIKSFNDLWAPLKNLIGFSSLVVQLQQDPKPSLADCGMPHPFFFYLDFGS